MNDSSNRPDRNHESATPEMEQKVSHPLRGRIAVAGAFCAALVVVGVILWQAVASYIREQAAGTNMMSIGLALKMYAKESDGEKYPPMVPYDDVWMFDPQVLYPEYLHDLRFLVSPNLPGYGKAINKMEILAMEEPIDWERVARLAARSFVYTAWVVQEPENFVTLQAERSIAGAHYDDNLPGDYYRLHNGIEQLLIADASNEGAAFKIATEVVVMVELPRLRNKKPKGWVMHLDGHLERAAECGFDDLSQEVLNILTDKDSR